MSTTPAVSFIALIKSKNNLLFPIPYISICLFVFTFILCGCGRFDEHVVTTVHAVLHPSAVTPYAEPSDQNTSTKLLLQASGWIEPDPYPVRISSLYDGIIKEVFVLEGEWVRKGQKLVSLINDDAALTLNLAMSQLDEAKSKEMELSSQLSLEALSLDKSKKTHLQAVALLNEKQDYLNRLETLPLGSVSTLDINQTRFQVEELLLSTESALVDVKIAKEQMNLISQRIETQKHISAVKRVYLEKARLDLNRTEIFSPIDGRILTLYASPGKRLMQKMDAPEASTALTLYNDQELQARVDVPISEASKLFIGQPVEISCSILPSFKFEGRLTRILGEADLQRNTLQVKIRILNPDKKLRPEMLCRARFLSKEENDFEVKNPTQLGVFVPISLRPKDNQLKKELWIVGKDGKTAELREVNFGEEIINDYILVLSGISAGDQIIINPTKSLDSGDPVKIINN